MIARPEHLEYGAVSKYATKPDRSQRNMFTIAGVVTLILVFLVPCWNAIALMGDQNYVYWIGRVAPLMLIVTAVVVTFLYAVTVFFFFLSRRPMSQTEQTLAMLAQVFISLIGAILMLASLALSSQVTKSYNQLMFNCENSEMTHRTYEYSQVLHNIRQQPDCRWRASVEECVGYEEAYPYTTFLKHMENDFTCSGFCYRPVMSLPGLRPLSLFSKANYEASCEGMAARDLRNFVGDISMQFFIQGITMIGITIITGLLKIIAFLAYAQ